MKTITVRDILHSDALLSQAIRLHEKHGHHGLDLHRELVKLIEPEMPAINERLGGQANDAHWMAFAVELALMRTAK
jgi:hypothetical protein